MPQTYVKLTATYPANEDRTYTYTKEALVDIDTWKEDPEPSQYFVKQEGVEYKVDGIIEVTSHAGILPDTWYHV